MNKNKSLILRLSLGVGMILLALISALQMLPPGVVAADAPAGQFSAERAMGDLKVVAKEPHAAGSAAQAQVGEYIRSQVEALGLAAEVETSGNITNLLVRVPGTDPTLTVMVSGHYDSHPPAPGAGDDGISVAAMLESLRVLRASSPLRNEIVFLFTDGEEWGWRGAQAFLQAHPEAKNETGVLLVFDAVPGNAPLSLLETSAGDGWLVREMAGLPLALWAASWKNLQERAETDTDWDTFWPAGYTGLAIENEMSGTRYHTAQDTVEAISPNLVQGYGQTMLALINHFGKIDLRARTDSPDLVFFTLSLVGLVAYPYWLMVAFSCLGILALLAIGVFAWQRSQFSLKRVLLAFLGLLGGVIVLALAAALGWGMVENSHAAEIAAYERFEGSAAWQAGFIIIAAVGMIVLGAVLARFLGGRNVAFAAPVLFLAAGFGFYFLTQADNPLTTAWLAWPFIGGVAGLGTLLFAKNQIVKTGLLLLSALLVLAVTIPQIWMATYTTESAWLTVLVTAVWASLFAPQAEAIFGGAEAWDPG